MRLGQGPRSGRSKRFPPVPLKGVVLGVWCLRPKDMSYFFLEIFNVFVIFLFSSANHPGHRTHGRSTRHNLLRATISHKAVEGRREAVFTAWDNPHGLASTHGGPPLHPLRGHQVFGPGAPHPKHRSLEEPSGGPHGAAGPRSLPNPLVRITPDPAVPRAPIPTPGRGRPPPPTLEATLDVSLPSQVSDQVWQLLHLAFESNFLDKIRFALRPHL